MRAVGVAAALAAQVALVMSSGAGSPSQQCAGEPQASVQVGTRADSFSLIQRSVELKKHLHAQHPPEPAAEHGGTPASEPPKPMTPHPHAPAPVAEHGGTSTPAHPAPEGEHAPQLGVVEHKSGHAMWHYSREDRAGRLSPASWHTGEGYAKCSQQGTQSPVDLRLGAAGEPPGGLSLPDPLVPVTNSSCDKGEFLINDHTTEVELVQTCPKQLYVDFPSGGRMKRFFLKQFNYHSPSEHTVDGQYFPMEVHHVHVADDGQALVICVLVGVGLPAGDNIGRAAFVANVLATMPRASAEDVAQSGGNKYRWLQNAIVNPYEHFIDLSAGYVYYSGSLTTPPCTPDTHWIVPPNAVLVPQSTLDLYRNMINSNPHNQLATFGDIVGLPRMATPAFHQRAGWPIWDPALGANNRPIQALQGADNAHRALYNVSARVLVPSDESAAAGRRGAALALSAAALAALQS